MLVSVPVTMMAVLAGAAVFDARSTASDATTVNHRVAKLTELVAVRDGVLALQSLESFDVRFEELSYTREEASAFIGVDLTARGVLARVRTNDAVASMGSDSPISRATLQDLYDAIDNDRISTTDAQARLATLATSVDDAVLDGLTQLDATLGDSTHAIVADLRSLRAVLNLDRSATLQGIDLSTIWFPSSSATPPTIAEATARLAGETEEYDASSQRVHEFRVVPVVAHLTAIEADSGVQVFDAGVRAALQGQPIAPPDGIVDATKVAVIFRGYLNRTALVDELVATTVRTGRDDAGRSASSAQFAFWAWIAAAAALGLISIKLAQLAARSIAKPLRDLSDYAHALHDGRLDTPPPDSRGGGPRETRIALAVVSDLADSLRLIDGKANALATGVFNDPILGEPLPGRLGQSLQASGTLLVHAIRDRDTAWRQSLQRLARAVELRDDATGDHIERVAAYSEVIARGLGLPADRCELILQAAPLHDLGKIGIPDHILLKPGKLTREERDTIERHCELGYQLLAGSGSDLLELAATIALTHHEHHNGSGYPRHLAGTDIPLEGRIVAVADVFDALTSDRAYRPAMSIDAAVELMVSERGTHFDPDILDAFLRQLDGAVILCTAFRASALEKHVCESLEPVLTS